MPRADQATTSTPSPPARRSTSSGTISLKGFGARVYPNGGKRYVAQTFRQRQDHPRADRAPWCPVVRGGQGARAQDHCRHRRGQEPEQGEGGRATVSHSGASSPTGSSRSTCRSHCKPRTRVEYRHAVERYILPALGSIKVTGAWGVTTWRRCTTRLREKPYQANRTLGRGVEDDEPSRGLGPSAGSLKSVLSRPQVQGEASANGS